MCVFSTPYIQKTTCLHQKLINQQNQKSLAWGVLSQRGIFCLLCFWLVGLSAIANAVPENLAPLASITANSEFNADYVAQNVANGVIPAAESRDDVGKAWAVNGATHLEGATLTFTWDTPQQIAELVFYGRTSFTRNDSWRRCTVFVAEQDAPVATQQLRYGHGAQRIPLDQVVQTKELRIEFEGSYGGPNPGASEIQVYAESPPDELLGDDSEIIFPIAVSDALTQYVYDGALDFDEMIVVQRQAVQPSHVYSYHQEGLSPGGGIYRVRITPDGPEKELLLDATEGVILDIDLSYDGQEILFSWKQDMEDYFQIFRMDIAGSSLLQVTDHASNNFNAAWLPDGGIVFLSDRKPAYAYCWITSTPILYRSDADGGNLVRLSANYLNDFTPSVMPDGRILYSRWEYVDRPAIPIQSLWAIRPDGTGLEGVFGNRILSPATFMEAQVVPGTNKILCVLTAHNGPCRGGLGVIDPRIGGNAQEAITNLTPDVSIGKVDEGDGNQIHGPYESPFPLDAEYFLCSHDGDLELRDFAMTGRAVLLEAEGALGWFQARPLRGREWTTSLPSMLTLDHVSDGMDNMTAEGRTGWADIFMQDVYVGLEPDIERGSITEIAVVQEIEKSFWAHVDSRAFGFQFPVVSSGATYAPKRHWGFARVEEDGSAYFKVPSGVPIYFMAIDQEGRAQQRMRTFTHLMPGEQQSCVGCHADRNYASPPVATVRPIAGEREPEMLRNPDWGVRGFSYPHIVQPVLDRHCISCHNAHEAPLGIDLSGDHTDFFSVSYDELVRRGTGAENWEIGGFPPALMGESPYTSWIPTYNGMESNILNITPGAWGSPASHLADLILSGHPDEAGEPRIGMAPEEMRRIFSWIDLNVPYYGTPESSNPELPGLRRMYPDTLDDVLQHVAARRCVSCHDTGGIPREFFTRISKPELNNFLLAPLADDAGGTAQCATVVFEDVTDPDYLAILEAFEPVAALMASSPREDMVSLDDLEVLDARAILTSLSGEG